MKIVIATHNQGKLREIGEILTGHEIVSAEEAGFYEEVEETGATFAENARLKAEAVCRATGLAALADDSGLCVDALGGAPGVYSARYSGGGAAENRKKLLRELMGENNRAAHFSCAVCLAFPDGREITAEGATHGQILREERGTGGFGYDSLFLSDDLGVSFAEAGEEAKNSVSHRGRALRALSERL